MGHFGAVTSAEMDGTQLAATCIPGISLPVNQNAPPDMNGDQALAGKILRKRKEEVARRQRLLNPRARMHGADLPALSTQVDEKKILAAAAAEAEVEDSKVQLMQAEVLESIEEAKRDFRREQHVQTMAFSLQNLNKESRREYDLSDPQRIKKDLLPKDGIGSDGRQIGLCAMQTFQGEKDVKQYAKQQRQTQREFLEQQVQEKKEREAAEKDADMQDAMTIMNGTKLREAIEAVEAQEAKQERMELAESNMQLVAEKQAKLQAKKDKEAALNAKVVSRARNDERLAEAYDFKTNAAGKLVRDEYKRLTLEQEQEVHDANAAIILEKQAAKRAEKMVDADDDGHLVAACGLMDQLHSLAAEQQKERRMKLVEENKVQAAQKLAREAEQKAERQVWLPQGTAPSLVHGK